MPKLNTAICKAAILEDAILKLSQTHNIHQTISSELVGLLPIETCGDFSIGECMDAIDMWRRSNHEAVDINTLPANERAILLARLGLTVL